MLVPQDRLETADALEILAYLLAGIVLFLWGVAEAPPTPWAQTLRMRIIPYDLRGDAFAFLRMLINVSRLIGGAGPGFLLPVIGVGATVGLTAAAIIVAGIGRLLCRPLREAERPSESRSPP